ncbi:MAG: diguanylate cyclase [Moraxellaceae bacterium]|nr:diguanylate cyclase [Moraxellaceae bacterium]
MSQPSLRTDTSSGVVARDDIESELLEIHTLLEGRAGFLRFSPRLERAFRLSVQQRAIELLNHGWWVVVFFYVGLGIFTRLQIHTFADPALLPQNVSIWWAVYLVEGVVVAVLLTLPRLPALDDWYIYYTGAMAMTALSAIIIATSAFPDPYVNQHASYVVIFITAIIYGIGGLRLLPATMACAAAGIFAYVVIREFDLWFNWGHFSQYVVLSNVVGILLCYLLEHRDRIMFLQSRLMETEKNKLDSLSRELTRLSREDVLTGLANRRHFNELFQQEWDRARRERRHIALIFIDVDHFKPFNDTHGHLEGDRALSEVGMALKSVLRRPGDLAARYGGEEFVLLLPNTPEQGACDVARQVQETLALLAIPHRASRVANYLTASLGVLRWFRKRRCAVPSCWRVPTRRYMPPRQRAVTASWWWMKRVVWRPRQWTCS